MVRKIHQPIGVRSGVLGVITVTTCKSLPFRDLGVIARRSGSTIVPP
jgi:hypothetical protein